MIAANVNDLLLDMLADYINNEPPEANENMPIAQQGEVARVHADWQGHVGGLYMLLGVRLVNERLEGKVSDV